MGRKTPLYEEHGRLNALMVEFGGWDMPLHYGSQIEEHHQVRRDAGMFDVSHMGVVDIKGEGSQAFLRYLLANNIDKLKNPGKALYGCMLNDKGGVIDDLITYFISPTHYRLVVNAATTTKDLQWMQKQAQEFSVSIQHTESLAMIAVQGPKALEKMGFAFPKLKEMLQSLKFFHFVVYEDWLIARTGYTGEAGVEIILPIHQVVQVWQGLIEQGVKPCGLGARDTLRLEAGLNLYGQDMDESVTPLESNLEWTLVFNSVGRSFIGQEALEKQKQLGVQRKLVGLVLQDKGVLRHDQKVFVDKICIGQITSGTFSPTLKESIGFARVKTENADLGCNCWIEIRGKHLKAKIVQLPFVRRENL